MRIERDRPLRRAAPAAVGWRLGLVAAAMALLAAGLGMESREPASARTIRVVVLNYDPILREHGEVRLSRHMGWHDPRALTERIVHDLREASRGFASYEVVEFLDVDAFPVKRDGFSYDEKSYLEMWADRNKAHQPDAVSYSAIFERFGLVERVRRDGIEEIWLWGAPYFGWDEYAMKIPGDLLFYPTDNPWLYRPYDIPDCGKTVWVMGWNYERGEAEALHSYGHRVEGILSLTVGQGVWDHQKTPDNVWNRFTRVAKDFPDDAQVGNVHFGPNSKEGYDYARKEAVLSGAEDWLSYPRLTGKKSRIDCEAWGGPDYHLGYMRWWLRHLPRAAGKTDGFWINWWRYVADYDEAVKTLPPPGGKPHVATTCMR
jgi:hypothetical protein